mmetsp:Transcript_19086/g.21035  ORF Transcript_19086/g.21035 Transcript_19086/m.21035 type:complete len:305 (+) Transcript_19086:121-1035(+)
MMIMISHLISPAKAVRVVFSLICILLSVMAAVIESTTGSTRNIVSKNEVAVTSITSQQEYQQEHRRSLMIDIGLNEMECHESLETTDGSIVCTFRIMPPTTTDTSTTTTNPNTLLQDCLFLTTIGNDDRGSNYCLTTEVYRSTSDAANQANDQQANAKNPATGQQQDCPTYKPQSGSQCGGWIPTGATARNCMYGDNRCDCNGDGMSEASSIIWICDGDLFGDNTPMTPVVTIDAELSSAIVPPTAPADQEPVLSSHSETIQLPSPENGPNCPSTMPNNGSTCDWLQFNDYSYQCGYFSGNEKP